MEPADRKTFSIFPPISLQYPEKVNRFLILLGVSLLLNACYKELPDEEGGREIIEMTVSPEMQLFMQTSKDTSYVIEDPALALTLNTQPVYVKRAGIRGQTSLDYRRKSFSLRLEYPIYIRDPEGDVKRLTSFKLLSLCMDYTYINNRLAYGIFRDAGMMPLFFKYVELLINGETQGVYLLIEDPETYAMESGSEYILRRHYHNAIRSYEYSLSNAGISRQEYENRFEEIYEALPLLKGEELYTYLASRINLEQYFRKMAIDYLLQNGDYTDEIWLYAKMVDGQIQYQPIPWDYDDIFSTLPHEVGRDWAVGKRFGPRSYPSHQDVLEVTGQNLVFSVEDDLDYIIATDPFLNSKYEQALAGWLSETGPSFLYSLFQEIGDELAPFYFNEDIIDQSQYDRQPTDRSRWEQNMDNRKEWLIRRLQTMKDHIHKDQP
jgi:spore coat protein H